MINKVPLILALCLLPEQSRFFRLFDARVLSVKQGIAKPGTHMPAEIVTRYLLPVTRYLLPVTCRNIISQFVVRTNSLSYLIFIPKPCSV